MFLSGTPALSRPIELFTQIIALDTSFRMKITDFGIRYCNGVKVFHYHSVVYMVFNV